MPPLLLAGILHGELDRAIERRQQAEHLIDRLPNVRLVEQPVELRGRRLQTPHDFAPAQAARCGPRPDLTQPIPD